MQQREIARTPDSVSAMGFLDRLRRPAHVDEASIHAMLTSRGATDAEAQQLIEVLGARLSPAEMSDWLAHPEKAHGIPDPDSEATFGATLNWTPVNAIAASKTELVIEEAKRYVRN